MSTIEYFWLKREKINTSLNKLYKTIGISKQGVHKMLKLKQKRNDEKEQLIRFIEDIRADHPSMGLRDMYFKINPDFMGRDKFEYYCKEYGFVLKQKTNYCKTTDSSGVKRFSNLIEKLTITKLNQVWQSDITYYEVEGRFYYITFILDSYSRRIIGHNVSKRLLTSYTTLPSLNIAFKTRKNVDLKGLIFHSDGGGQYYADEFLKTTSKFGIINSMCKNAYENGKAERVNGVIKNNYLKYKKINSYEKLVKEVDHAVKMYNHEKPHIMLKRKSPIQFENNLLNLYNNETAKIKNVFNRKTSDNMLLDIKKRDKTVVKIKNIFVLKEIES